MVAPAVGQMVRGMPGVAGDTGGRSPLRGAPGLQPPGSVGARAAFGRGAAAALPGIYMGGSSPCLEPSGHVGIFET